MGLNQTVVTRFEDPADTPPPMKMEHGTGWTWNMKHGIGQCATFTDEQWGD